MVRTSARFLLVPVTIAVLAELAFVMWPGSRLLGVTSLPRIQRVAGCAAPTEGVLYCDGPNAVATVATQFRTDTGVAPLDPGRWVSEKTGLRLTRITVYWQALPHVALQPARYKPVDIHYIFGRPPRIDVGNPPWPRYIDVTESVGSDPPNVRLYRAWYDSGGAGPWVGDFGVPSEELDYSVMTNLPKITIEWLSRLSRSRPDTQCP